MAENPEASTQLARLLGEPGRTFGSLDDSAAAVQRGFDRLVTGLLEEAAASDDVTDSESARSFLDDRIAFLGGLMTPAQSARLKRALHEKIAAW